MTADGTATSEPYWSWFRPGGNLEHHKCQSSGNCGFRMPFERFSEKGKLKSGHRQRRLLQQRMDDAGMYTNEKKSAAAVRTHIDRNSDWRSVHSQIIAKLAVLPFSNHANYRSIFIAKRALWRVAKIDPFENSANSSASLLLISA